MSRVCEICGKHKTVGGHITRRGLAKKKGGIGMHKTVGGHITRRGLAKKKGGIGMHVVKNTKRTFSPNLQTVKVNDNGTIKTIKVCTACIRSNRIVKA